MRYQTIKGAHAVDYRGFRRAIQVIESGVLPVGLLHTHHFPPEEAAQAIRALELRDDASPAIAITIEPGIPHTP